MLLNAVKHGVTGGLNVDDLGAWVDVITYRGTLAPRDSQEALALAEVEIRLIAAQIHWRREVAEAAKELEDTEKGKEFGSMIAQIRGISEATGKPIDKEGARLLKSLERAVLKLREGPSRDLRLASRYLSEAFSARERRLNEWIECVGAFSRNENTSSGG